MVYTRTLWLLSIPVLSLAACGDQSQTADADSEMAEMPMTPSVVIARPMSGASVTGPNVDVALTVSNFRIAPSGTMDPGTGHHHIFVDRDVTPMGEAIPAGVEGVLHYGGGQTEVTIEGLSPGPHRLIAVVADGMHVPVSPPMMDTVNITVGP